MLLIYIDIYTDHWTGGRTLKRWQQQSSNQATTNMLKKLIIMHEPEIPSYALVTEQLNKLGFTTSRGNPWTAQRLLRMLQRNSIGGLDGLKRTRF